MDQSRKPKYFDERMVHSCVWSFHFWQTLDNLLEASYPTCYLFVKRTYSSIENTAPTPIIDAASNKKIMIFGVSDCHIKTILEMFFSMRS